MCNTENNNMQYYANGVQTLLIIVYKIRYNRYLSQNGPWYANCESL